MPVAIPGTVHEIVKKMKAHVIKQNSKCTRYQDGDRHCIFGAVMPMIDPNWDTDLMPIDALIQRGIIELPESIDRHGWQELQNANDLSISVDDLLERIDEWADFYESRGC